MNIILNGESRPVADGSTIADLVHAAGLADAPCAAERNGTLVPKADHASTSLQEGDRVELVTLVGGG